MKALTERPFEENASKEPKNDLLTVKRSPDYSEFTCGAYPRTTTLGNPMRSLLFVCLIGLSTATHCCQAQTSPVDWVNEEVGTAHGGQTFPATGLPDRK